MVSDQIVSTADRKVVMYWLQAQRNRLAVQESFMTSFFPSRSRAAAQAGMDLRYVSVDDIVVLGSSDGAKVLVCGEEIHRDSCFFHTKLLTWPDVQIDIWRMLSVFDAVEAAGFHTTVPASLNIATNDKLVALLRYADPTEGLIPTLRISTRQFSRLPIDDLGMDYPVVVKPASWGGGYGVMRAENRRELETILQFAGASELTMVIQPWLGRNVVDYRVYCIDGSAYKAMTRKPSDGAVAGNYHQGGVMEVVDVPQELVRPSERLANSLGLAYMCVDFLRADSRFWLSEIEADGTTSTDELTQARFAAYRRQFDRYVGGQPRRGRV